jgi:hypothetical protein
VPAPEGRGAGGSAEAGRGRGPCGGDRSRGAKRSDAPGPVTCGPGAKAVREAPPRGRACGPVAFLRRAHRIFAPARRSHASRCVAWRQLGLSDAQRAERAPKRHHRQTLYLSNDSLERPRRYHRKPEPRSKPTEKMTKAEQSERSKQTARGLGVDENKITREQLPLLTYVGHRLITKSPILTKSLEPEY